MSFTAQVKDELSRVDPQGDAAKHAQLSALLHVSGTLSYYGPGRYSLRVSTETGAVARTMIKLTHELFDLETPLTVRHSVLHKTRNYLIEIPEQEELEDDLIELGILSPGRGLASGVPAQFLKTEECRRSFLRGAFMAGGFVADPRGDFHLEIAVTGEDYAQDLVRIASGFGVTARINRRRGYFVIYLKSYDEVVCILRAMGASFTAQLVEGVRGLKKQKNAVNRRINAEMANIRRASAAGTDQTLLAAEAERLIGFSALPPAVREFCMLRLANPELSLAELGQMCTPPASKSAMYHRVLRLQELVEAARKPKDGASN